MRQYRPKAYAGQIVADRPEIADRQPGPGDVPSWLGVEYLLLSLFGTVFGKWLGADSRQAYGRAGRLGMASGCVATAGMNGRPALEEDFTVRKETVDEGQGYG